MHRPRARARHSARPSHPRDPRATPLTPPFDNLAARRLRTGLGMEPEHVAYGMRSSYGLPHVTPDLVIDWERGTATPTGPELTALAGMLWCSTNELAGRPRTLREHRVARGLAPEDVARAVGLDLLVYLGMEEIGLWRGTDRQSAALTELLGLSLADFVTVTGRDERLAELLRDAVTTRRQGPSRPVAELLSLDRRFLEVVLQELHAAYQERLATSPTRANGTAAADASEAGRDFLDHIVERFWWTVGRSPHRP